MSDRKLVPPEYPDASNAAAAPAAGFMLWQGLNGRPIARNSSGTIFDLAGEVFGADGAKITGRVGWQTLTGFTSSGLATVHATKTGLVGGDATFAAILVVEVQPVGIQSSQVDKHFPGGYTISGSAITVEVLRGASILLGGASTRPAFNGTQVRVTVLGQLA